MKLSRSSSRDNRDKRDSRFLDFLRRDCNLRTSLRLCFDLVFRMRSPVPAFDLDYRCSTDLWISVGVTGGVLPDAGRVVEERGTIVSNW
jgi:hypothetical protein